MPTATTDWWVGTGAALFGAIVGSFIPLLWQRSLRAKERRGELVGMQVEMRQAWIDIHNLLSDKIPAPLYRLPLAVFKQSLPKLIGEEKLTTDEVGVLVDYLNKAEELNRGLDRAGNAHAAREEILLQEEFGRACLKAEALKGDDGKSLFVAAQIALSRVYAMEERSRLPLGLLRSVRM